MATFRLNFEGYWVRVIDAPMPVLEETCSIWDPNRANDPRYVAGTWDGKVTLSTGRRVPLGLLHKVKDALAATGNRVAVTKADVVAPVTLDAFRDDMLRGIKFRPEQREGCATLASNRIGQASVVTAGGKTAMIAAMAQFFYYTFGWHSLCVTERAGVARKNAQAFAGLCDDNMKIGMLGAGQSRVGVLTSAVARQFLKCYGGFDRSGEEKPVDSRQVELLRQFQVLFFDEAHRASSPTWTNIALASPALRRYGFTGTTETGRTVRDFMATAVVGPVRYRKDNATMLALGRIREAKIVMIHSAAASHPRLSDKPPPWGPDWEKVHAQAIVYSRVLNASIVQLAEWMVRKGRRPLILCQELSQFRTLSKGLTNYGVRHVGIEGKTAHVNRDALKAQFVSGESQALLSTRVLDEGEDVSAIDAIIVADAGKSWIAMQQRIGRGLRKEEDGPDDCWVGDFWPTSHRYTREHGEERMNVYSRIMKRPVQILTEWALDKNGYLEDDALLF